MTPDSPEVAADSERELVLTRVFDAPRHRVFEAWTTPELLNRWYGPKGFASPTIDMEFRVGGAYRHCLRGPDGKEYWHHGVYREIVPQERIVFTAFLDSIPDYEFDSTYEIVTTVTFVDLGDTTEMTVRQVYKDATLVHDASVGWAESFERLDKYLAGV